MVTLAREWSEFIGLLLRRRVRFLLIGAHALAAHGRPRATLDLDLFIDRTPDNVARLARALADFGYRDSAGAARYFTEPNRMMQLGREPLRIDILNQISGVRFATAWRNSIVVRLDQHRVKVLALRDFRRAKDLLDLALLDEVRAR